MKTLLLIAITIFFGTGAYAQANKLNCTEQAFTFKINLPTGARSYSPKIGQFDLARMPTGVESLNVYCEKPNPPEIIPNVGFEKVFTPTVAYNLNNTVSLKKMTFPYLKVNIVTAKFTPTTYGHFKLLPMPVVNLTPF